VNSSISYKVSYKVSLKFNLQIKANISKIMINLINQRICRKFPGKIFYYFKENVGIM